MNSDYFECFHSFFQGFSWIHFIVCFLYFSKKWSETSSRFFFCFFFPNSDNFYFSCRLKLIFKEMSHYNDIICFELAYSSVFLFKVSMTKDPDSDHTNYSVQFIISHMGFKIGFELNRPLPRNSERELRWAAILLIGFGFFSIALVSCASLFTLLRWPESYGRAQTWVLLISLGSVLAVALFLGIRVFILRFCSGPTSELPNQTSQVPTSQLPGSLSFFCFGFV